MNEEKRNLWKAKHYTFIAISLLFFNKKVISQLTFSINSLSGTSSITCTNPVITLSASSNYSAPVSYTWANSQTITVSNSLSVTSPASFTITASSGTVTSSQTLAIGVNTTVPSFTITANTNDFTCINYSIVLTAVASPSNVTFQWRNPSPGIDPTGPTCFAYIPGTHTCIATDPINGCKATKTIILGDNRIYPFASAAPTSTIACPNGTTILTTSVIGSTNNIIYTWSNGTATITSAANASSLVVNSPGYYQVVVTNTLNGCMTQTVIGVYACVGVDDYNTELNVRIFPNPLKDQLFVAINNDSMPIQVSLFNSLGQFIFSESNIIGQQAIDMRLLPSGVYTLDIKGESLRKLTKIIKE